MQKIFHQMLPVWDTETSRNPSTGKACEQQKQATFLENEMKREAFLALSLIICFSTLSKEEIQNLVATDISFQLNCLIFRRFYKLV